MRHRSRHCRGVKGWIDVRRDRGIYANMRYESDGRPLMLSHHLILNFVFLFWPLFFVHCLQPGHANLGRCLKFFAGLDFEEIMSKSEREDFLSDHPHIRQLPSDQVNIVWSLTYSGITNDGGWNEQMSRISDAHPTSEVANQYGDKSAKAVKTRQAVEKWRKKRSADNSK